MDPETASFLAIKYHAYDEVGEYRIDFESCRKEALARYSGRSRLTMPDPLKSGYRQIRIPAARITFRGTMMLFSELNRGMAEPVNQANDNV